MRTALITVAVVSTALSAVLPSGRATAAGGYPAYRDGEYGHVLTINPAGQTGFVSPADVAQHEQDSSHYAPHQADQLRLYDDLVRRAGTITQATLAADYKDGSFGVKPDDVAAVETPAAAPTGLTIVRDKSFGVPHIYGRTDDDVVYGAGWVLGEDRLFMTDVLRHYGRSTLASFLGPSRAYIEMDCAQAQLTGYTEAELNQQIDQLGTSVSGEPYSTLAASYVKGINDYIDATATDPTKLPAEYSAFGLRPQHFNGGDVIAIAGLVGGIFGKGGGVETRNAAFLRALYAAFGGPTNSASSDPGRALQLFRDMMANNDPAAPTTISRTFHYEDSTPSAPPSGAALTKDPPGDPVGSTCTVSGTPPTGATSVPGVAGLLDQPRLMSNALLVDAQHSTTGHPIAVFGPQVGYYFPQILMEEDLHGPHFAARGVSFPGTNFIVELGHGPDYAWSATSAGTDNVDQFVERLCNPAGSDPLANVDPQSTSYLHNGQCVAMTERTTSETAVASAGSTGCLPSCPPTTVTFKIERTVHGPVLSRTTAFVGGREVPVAISTQRSTFLHEADSVAGFAGFNDPGQMTNSADFLHAASKITYTFNWFYADNRDIAYYQSGQLPIRAQNVDPDLPTWGTGQYDWSGEWLDVDSHCHDVNPAVGFMTSWNNKGCRGFRAADDQWSYGEVHRSQSLTDQVSHFLSSQGGRMSLVDLDNAMAHAALVDLEGTQVLPLALQALQGDAAVAAQVQQLQSWLDAGALRVHAATSSIYDHIKAIELMDAWWPRLQHAIFDPSLGSAFGSEPQPFENPPGPRGSAYIEGWHGADRKALEMALGQTPALPYQAVRCADGTLAGCRTALERSLLAAAQDAAGANDSAVTSSDNIQFSTIGLYGVPSIEWQNRPTFQQVVDIEDHRPAVIPGPNVPEGRPLLLLVGVGALLTAVGRRTRRARRLG